MSRIHISTLLHLKIDFVVVADQIDAGEGSIDYYFKKFGLPEDEDIEEESKQLGV